MGLQGIESLRILFVDDHLDTVKAMKGILSGEGHQVETARGFNEAVALVRRHTFDVLVTDIGMPGHDGYELLKMIRSIYPVRSIAVTGYGMPADVKRIAEAGFHHYLLKPVDAGRLCALLENLAREIAHDRHLGLNADQQLASTAFGSGMPESSTSSSAPQLGSKARTASKSRG